MEADVDRPQVGKNIQLIRWRQGRDGWVSEVCRGRFLGRDEENWLLEVDGEERRLSRMDWDRFLSDHDARVPPRSGRNDVRGSADSRPIFEQ
jgi:hypothetical protein